MLKSGDESKHGIKKRPGGIIENQNSMWFRFVRAVKKLLLCIFEEDGVFEDELDVSDTDRYYSATSSQGISSALPGDDIDDHDHFLAPNTTIHYLPDADKVLESDITHVGVETEYPFYNREQQERENDIDDYEAEADDEDFGDNWDEMDRLFPSNQRFKNKDITKEC